MLESAYRSLSVSSTSVPGLAVENFHDQERSPRRTSFPQRSQVHFPRSTCCRPCSGNRPDQSYEKFDTTSSIGHTQEHSVPVHIDRRAESTRIHSPDKARMRIKIWASARECIFGDRDAPYSFHNPSNVEDGAMLHGF
jgi:hypothetical protein